MIRSIKRRFDPMFRSGGEVRLHSKETKSFKVFWDQSSKEDIWKKECWDHGLLSHDAIWCGMYLSTFWRKLKHLPASKLVKVKIKEVCDSETSEETYHPRPVRIQDTIIWKWQSSIHVRKNFIFSWKLPEIHSQTDFFSVGY